MIKGIPKLQVPPIDPFILPALEVTRDQEAIKVRAHLTNIVAYGGKDFVVNRLKTDLDKLVVEGTVTLPFIQATADYDVDAGITVDAKGDGKIVQKNGEDYFEINNLKTKIKVQDSNVKINQGDDRNGALAQSAINFYNQNKQQVLGIIMPIVQETAEEIIIQMGNRILGSAPVSEFLPA
ncbi:hypothetical protein C0J52_20874 [Blattella germanica]|nr:hypothetical protein C0J52_20874 [Blattella germanica]